MNYKTILLTGALFAFLLGNDGYPAAKSDGPTPITPRIQRNDYPVTIPAGSVRGSSATLSGQRDIRGPGGGATMFGSTGNLGATFITIDPLTGAATPIGPHGAFGPVADIDCSPSGVIFGGTGGGTGNLITIDPVGPVETLVGNNGLGGATIALEWVGSTLYGILIFAGGGGSPSDLVTLDPNTGLTQLVGPTGLGPIGGLAYDTINGIMYGVESGGGSAGRLVTINLNTGAAAIVGPTGFTDVAALEFHPTTGALFAGIGGGDPAAGSLILINPATGFSALVGSTGFPVLSGITFCAGGCGGSNESFETGSFAGWFTQDLGVPFFPLQVGGAGIGPGFGFFSSAPTDGSFAALHGFDGNGPGTIIIEEDVILPAGVGSVEFDYRAAWDLATFGASADRIFEVVIRPFGGGLPLQPSELILTAPAGTIQLDTGDLVGSVNVSAFSGQAVRLSFEWFVPQNFSGPAFFQLDNIRCTPCPPPDQPQAENKLGLNCVLDTDCPNLSVCIKGECYVPKGKYISLRPGNAGQLVALRVTMISNAIFPALIGSQWWVQPNAAGDPGKTFRLGCDKWYQDWAAAPAVIHVGDRHITSQAVYRVEAVHIDCDNTDPASYSPPLDLPTVEKFGDAVGAFVGVYPPSDGFVNLVDVFAAVQAFQGLPTAPNREWVDVDGDVPNAVVNLADAFVIVIAFQSGGAYPYPGPVPCP